MRTLLMLTMATVSLCSSIEAQERDETRPSLLRMPEFSTAGYSELMQLKIRRYNASVRTLQVSHNLWINGKLSTTDLTDKADALIECTLDMYRKPATRILILRKRVEYMAYLHHYVTEGPFIGEQRSKFLIARSEALLLDAQVKLLEAK